MDRSTTIFKLFLCLLLLLIAAPVFAQTAAVAPENPAFATYLRGYGMGGLASAGDDGLIPEPLDLSHLKYTRPGFGIAAVPPPTYDLRSLGKLTPIKNQGGCGSCWAFAATGSLESSLMPGQLWDFSENNLKNLHGFDFSCCAGGNRTMASAYFARWAGPVGETDDPYNSGSCASPAGVLRVPALDIIFVPDRASSLDNDRIKQAIMAYGAVYSTYYHSDTYYDSTNRSYYYTSGGSANHAICLVGWDDSFSSTSFRTPALGNGAFIARNSWGTGWGQSGYFYISYYDALIGMENAAFTADAAFTYDGVYQYDTYGWISSCGYGSQTAWFANVFTAAADSTIAAASWYAASPSSSYALYVYKNPTSGPAGGTLASSKSGVLADAGYRTVALDVPVAVTAGQKFSLVVQQTTPGYNYPVPMERPYPGYCSAATAGPGQSYISSNGTSWSDLTTVYSQSNACLKAFASQSAPPPPPTPGSLSVTPSDGLASTGTAGGPFTPATKVLTLVNTGGTALNWTAQKTAGWLSLSSTSGLLAAGASTTVTVSINATANSLVAGSYSDTVTITNATNGSGNTTRPVTLTVKAPASYREEAATYSWIAPDSHSRVSLSDNASSKKNLPFAFKYYGTSYTTLYVGSNGLVGFGSSGMTSYLNGSLPYTGVPNAAIYPYWDDLNPKSGGLVRMGTVGVAPNRKVVISWVGVPHRNSLSAKFTFQVLLCEGTNDIVFQYQNVATGVAGYGAGASATIGIENQTGTSACLHSYQTAGAVSNSSAIRYTTGITTRSVLLW